MLRGEGRFDEALAACDAALRCDPGLAQAHRIRGDVLRDLKQLHEAVFSHDQAIRLAPANPATHMGGVAVRKQLGRLPVAMVNSVPGTQVRMSDRNAP